MLEVLHQSPSSCSKAADQLLLLRVDDDVAGGGFTDDCESLFMGDNDLLIDFTCCDVVPSLFDADILPDLEAVDPTELLAEFDEDNHHHHHHHEEEEEEKGTNSSTSRRHHQIRDGEEDKWLLLQEKTKEISGGDEVLSAVTAAAGSSSDDTSKSSSSDISNKTTKKKKKKNSNGKRKVDWTPDLHRRFVQAVEQLGIDKAVPSRILEMMGIECLTRHNIASHLQKYRSHRKHLMAREAEAATWAHKRQLMYAAAKKDMPPPPTAGPCPLVLPTIGFPPFARPLHVWGHPPTTAVEAPTMLPAVWPRHLQAPAAAAYCWHHQNNNRKWAPHQPLTQCVPPTTAAAAAMLPRFPAMMPHPMYRPPPMMMSPPQTRGSNKLATLQIQLDTHPSKESIDAAIGDVLVKPWLPLPLGLKPPSLHSVMSELHKQGIPKIPPAATTANSSTSNSRA